MALDESTDGLERMESNGIEAFIEPKLKEFLSQYGSINIDFVDQITGKGFTIRAGEPGATDCGSCSGSCES